MWFKLFVYSNAGAGPTSMLITKGERLKRIPPQFKVCFLLFRISKAHLELCANWGFLKAEHQSLGIHYTILPGAPLYLVVF